MYATGNSRIIVGKETEWGDGGGTIPKAFVLRRTNFKVDAERQEIVSNEMRSDPFAAPSRLGAPEIKGEFGFEVVPGAHDVIIAAILHNEWQGNRLDAGADFRPRSLFMEDDTFGKHTKFTGVVLEKLGLSFGLNEIVSASVSFLARMEDELDESSVDPSDLDTAPETMAALEWDGQFKIDGISTGVMTTMSLDITRTVNLFKGLGSKYPTEATLGRFEVTGSMTIKPSDTSWWQKLRDESRISLEVTVFGVPNTKSYKFSLPKLLLTGAPKDLSDPDKILIDIPFKAEVDETSGVPMFITRTV